MDESCNRHRLFSHRLCSDWEASAAQFEKLGCRVCYLRTGIVLGDEGALAKMLPAFKLALGGPMGTGEQWMSWVHIEDMVSLNNALLLISQISVVRSMPPRPIRRPTDSLARPLGAALHSAQLFFTMPGPAG